MGESYKAPCERAKVKESDLENKAGDLKIWWVPRLAMRAFELEVSSLSEAKKVLNALDVCYLFQFNNTKHCYCNIGGLFVFETKNGWVDWKTDCGEEINDLSLCEIEQLEKGIVKNV